MEIGLRIGQLREQQNLSRQDIEERTGLLRSYISRVENGHTVPSLETLMRLAAILDVPLYRFLLHGGDPLSTGKLPPHRTLEQLLKEGGKDQPHTRFLLKLKKYAGNIVDRDREILLTMAKRLATA